MSHHYIELKNVSFSYNEKIKAIDNVSFRIEHGESVALIGENGAGKSTLLMLLLGILFPQSGEINVGGIKLTKNTVNMIRQKIGYCFQKPDDQLFMTTVYDDVAFGPRSYNLSEDEVQRRVNAALEKVNKLHLIDRFTYKLSGGEKRLVSIATVLAMEVDILAMDEPTSELDPKARRNIINLLKDFQHTKIIATHDLDMALELCSRVIALKNGVVLYDGPSRDILTDKIKIEECGLELPLSLQKII